MDSEGYLPVTLVASFNRVRSLTNDVTFIVQVKKIWQENSNSNLLKFGGKFKLRFLTIMAGNLNIFG